MTFRNLTIVTLLFGSLCLLAQNPIVPPGVYVADPAARVWDDGQLYIYGSVDESIDYYCSHRYHVLSTTDLMSWEIHENTFWSRGEEDRVPYNETFLYAPDCESRDGKYYMYYCQPDTKNPEGVAVADKPTGPFSEGRPIDLGGHQQIDPGVFIDDDGQAYYLWGQFTLKMAKLNPDMKSLDQSTLIDSVITEGAHGFHEGAHMVKRNGIYYLVYAQLSHSDMPTCLGYCISTSPMGPYEYGGVIVDNDHCDPGVWNNHGSIAEYKGQWYVFYHRSTHNSVKMRKACVEPIYFNEDGSIDQVEMTSQGAGPPLKATSTIFAERACLLLGNVRIQAWSEDNEELGKIDNDDRAGFKYVDFAKGVDKISVRLKPGKKGGSITFFADSPWGPKIGTVEVEGSRKDKWITLSSEADSSVKGVRTLWLVFNVHGRGHMSVDEFVFE